MKKTITNYVDNCKICQVHKGRAHPKQPLRKFPLPDRPFETISTDLIGPLNVTSSHHKYILVVTDFLTRYCAIKPLHNKSANEVAEKLWEIWCEHGTPHTMFSDSGLEFRNQILKEMNKKLQVKHSFVAVYHPSSNGLCERKNSSILTTLKCFLHLEEWDKLLPTIQLAVNAAYCSSLGDSPFLSTNM